MTVFPNYQPVYSANLRSTPNLQENQMGDGYTHRLRFGLNVDQNEWSLTFNVDETEANEIENFLNARIVDGLPFQWTPPNQAKQLQWKCESWRRDLFDLDRFKIDVTFVQVIEQVTEAPFIDDIDQVIDYWGSFDWVRLSLIPSPTVCEQDELCVSDYGQYQKFENWDVWVARLDGEPSTWGTCSYTFEDGDILVAYFYSNEVIVSRFAQNGSVVWTKQYSGATYNGASIASEGILLAAVENENRLILCWRTETNQVTWTGTPGSLCGLMSINRKTGSFQWAKHFTLGIINQNCLANSRNTYGAYSELFSVKYDPNLNIIIVCNRSGTDGYDYVSTSFDPDGTFYNQVLARNQVFTEGARIQSTGYIGNDPYILCANQTRYTLFPGLRYHMGDVGSGYIFEETYIEGGVSCWVTGNFLGNGQLAMLRAPFNPDSELMIIGEGMKIVDHVKFPRSSGLGGYDMRGFSDIDWPLEGWKGLMSPGLNEIKFVPEDSMIYLIAHNKVGILTYGFNVTINSANQIVSIDSIAKRGSTTVNSLYNYAYMDFGATKHMSAVPDVNRVTVATNGAVMSIAASNFDTKDVEKYLNVGTVSALFNEGQMRFRATKEEILISRTDLQGYIASYTPSWPIQGSYIPVEGSDLAYPSNIKPSNGCTGTFNAILGYNRNVKVIDKTDTLTYTLYKSQF